MNPNTGWLFPGTILETILKTRPMAMALFEKHGLNPWKAPRETLAAHCDGHGVDCSLFRQELDASPVPRPDSEWNALPIYHLLDYLTSQHRDFTRIFVPAIGHILSNISDADSESLFNLRGFAMEWPAFTNALSSHLAEEEDVLFFRLLRYDSCLRLGNVDPDFESGSVRVFAAVRMHEHDHRDAALLKGFLAKALPSHPDADGNALVDRLRPLLREFQAALGRHARLETEVLLPWARSLEKSLYDLRIRGEAAAETGPGRIAARLPI